MAVGTTQHIKLGAKEFLLKNFTYTKTEIPPATIPTTGRQLDLSEVRRWHQDSWRGGLGQRDWEDPEMYDEGFIDSYTHAHRLTCLPRVKFLSTATVSTFKDQRNIRPRMLVRQEDDANFPLLFFIVNGPGTDDGELWRTDANITAITRIADASTVTDANFNPTAIGHSWKHDPHSFMVGTSARKIYKMPKSNNTNINATAAHTFTHGHPRAIQNFQDADYYGLGGAPDGAIVAKVAGSTPVVTEKFYDSSMTFVQSMAVWNSRLWVLATDSAAGRTKLFVSDGNVVNLAYTWNGHFRGEALHSHHGHLYVAGGEYNFDESASIGQVWRYNGATMDLIGQFDKTGIAGSPVFDTSFKRGIRGLHSFGKFLVASNPQHAFTDGTSRRGLYFYDPEQDAWHTATYILPTDITATTGAIPDSPALQEFDGRLWMLNEDSRGKLFYLPNDKSEYVKSQIRTSIFDAGLPWEKKQFTRIRLDVETTLTSQIVVEYSTDRGGNWTTAATINHNPTTPKRLEEINLGASGVGVEGLSLQLRITLYPGDTSGTAPLTEGTTTPKVYSHTTDYYFKPTPLHNWNFTIIAAANLIGPDGTVDSRSGSDILGDINTLRTTDEVITFTDVDGSTHNVRFSIGSVYRPLIENEDKDDPLYSEVSLNVREVR